MELNQNSENREVMIRVSGLKKKYLLGRFGANTLQGTIKIWRETRKNPKRAKELRSKRNRSFYALDGVDLTVYKGETLGILGKNGAGKSTLLKIMSRITAPTEGTIDLYGHVTSMLEVGTGFHGEMTGRENIYLNGAILGMSKAEIDAKIDDIIRFSELEEFIDTPVKRYSSGMFVKLGFSVAFHLDSEIVIMDEVLAVGDMDFQRKCISSLLEAANSDVRTILYVSHNMNSIRQLCKRCIVLDKGKVIFDGDVNQAISIYLGAKELMPSDIKYGPEHRPDDYLIRKIPFLTIEKLHLANKSDPIFDDSESAVLDFTCLAERDLTKVGMRFELWYQDGSKIATSMPGDFFNLKTGANTVRVTLPLTHLTPGRYSADIIAFKVDEFGNERKLDALYPGFTFQVEQSRSKENYMKWNHQHWGVIRLDDNHSQIIDDDHGVTESEQEENR